MARKNREEFDVVEEEIIINTPKKEEKCKCIRETRDINCKKHGR